MKRVPIRRLARFAYGDSLAAGDRIDGPIPVYGSNGPVGSHTEANTAAPVIIVGRKGSYGALKYSKGPVFAIDTTYFIDPDLTSSDLRWLYYALQTAELGSLSADTGVPGLSRETAYDTRIPWTQPEKQRRIADFLDRETERIDALIDKKLRLIVLLEEKRTATITHAVTKGLNPAVPMKDSGIPWVGKMPAFWTKRSLRSVASLRSGESITSDDIRSDGRYPVFGGNGVRGYGDRKTHTGDHVLIGRQGALSGNINYALGEFFASEHAIVLSPVIPSPLYWLGELIRTMDLLQYSKSAAQPGIAVDVIGKLPVPVPPIEERQAISTAVEREIGRTRVVTENLETQLSLFAEYREALITAAVTGEFDVDSFDSDRNLEVVTP